MTVHTRNVYRENARLAELERLHVADADGESDRDLDLIVRTAAALFDVPIALVTRIDDTKQRNTASFGLTTAEMSRELPFCAHTIADPGRVLIVPDATRDERFANDPLVTGESALRFYAGAPLVSKNGFGLGALCLVDRRSRAFTAEQSTALQRLATLAMRFIERHIEDDESVDALSLHQELEHPVIAVFAWDVDARIVSWSAVAESMLGWAARDVLGALPPFAFESDAQRFTSHCADALAGRGEATRSYTVRTRDDRYLRVALGATRAIAGDDTVRGMATMESRGDRYAGEHRLAMLESVLAHSNDAILVTAGRTSESRDRIVFVNDAFRKLSGFDAEETIGNTPFMLYGPATDSALLSRITVNVARSEAVSDELIAYRKDGSTFWVEASYSPVLDDDGHSAYCIIVLRETTLRRALATYERDRSLILEMAVRNEPLRTVLARIVVLLKSVIPGSMGTVLLLDGDRVRACAADPQLSLTYIAAIDGERIGPRAGSCGTGVFTRKAVICGDIATDDRWRDYRDVALAAGLRACWSIPLIATNGDVVGAYALYADRRVLPTPHQMQLFEETARFAALVVDRDRDRRRLERMALYDALTGLPNRKLLEEALSTAIARADEAGTRVAFGVLDIDRFKAINDAFGHHIGDELLRGIAGRLATALTPGDAIGRMAGDEFLIVFADLAHDAEGIERAARLLDAFVAPFIVCDYEIVVRPSCGLALYPATSTEIVSLFASADKAMYAAKQRGGGLEIAQTPVDGAALKMLDLEKDLRYALARGEFTLHYQMQYHLGDARPVGAEALLRWNHPQLGTIGPADFIPLAEANGTIVALGTWVIKEAVRVARTWQDSGHDAFVSVNVSALQFDAPGLVAIVTDTLERHALQAHRLHLELTESLVMRNPVNSVATLVQLKALGVRIVIDDFGTGYSSLAYLQQFTFDALKIDRAFVRGIGVDATSDRSEHIVAAVVQLGRALGVTTIAEGVEDRAQHAFVRSCGCDVVQGFLCARPVPVEHLRWEAWNDVSLSVAQTPTEREPLLRPDR